MHYLTIEQRESIQYALTARADILRDQAGHAIGQRPSHREETDDDAVIDLEASLEVDSLQRSALELRAVEKALQRLHTLEYGECADCGGDIPFVRLRANPMSMRCTACQAAYERTHATPDRHTL